VRNYTRQNGNQQEQISGHVHLMTPGLPEIPDPSKQITKTKDFFHSAVRAPRGQPKPFHQSNNFFAVANKSALFPPIHRFTCVLVPVHDVNPSGERGTSPSPTRSQK
jgi:hypothetical protein